MLELHPEFLIKNGKKEFVILTYEEFIEIQTMLEPAFRRWTQGTR